jgi:hypothetical protein
MKHNYRHTPTPRLVEMLDALLAQRERITTEWFHGAIDRAEYRQRNNEIAPTIEALRHEIAKRNIKESRKQ